MSSASEISQQQSKSALKNPLFYSTTVLVIATLAVGGILFSRWQENHRINELAARNAQENQLRNDRAALEQFGGKELAIQSFYATPGVIHRGESVQLCYGVANAKSVTLEPQSNPVWPSYSRCVNVSLKRDTAYTLTITDAAGNTKSETTEVRVR